MISLMHISNFNHALRRKKHLFVIQSQETLFNKSDDFSVQLQITISLLIIVVDIAYMYTNDREVKSINC